MDNKGLEAIAKILGKDFRVHPDPLRMSEGQNVGYASAELRDHKYEVLGRFTTGVIGLVGAIKDAKNKVQSPEPKVDISEQEIQLAGLSIRPFPTHAVLDICETSSEVIT